MTEEKQLVDKQLALQQVDRVIAFVNNHAFSKPKSIGKLLEELDKARKTIEEA